MNKKKSLNQLLAIVSIIVIFLALVNLGITFYKFGGIKELTGYATDAGTANLTIMSQATVNFTTEIINWGSGAVNEGASNATLVSNGTVTLGNWTVVSQGLTIQNDGNANVKLNLTTSNNAANFIGGGGPLYRLNVSNNESNNSCASGLAPSWYDADTTSQSGCLNFTYYDARDALDIDVLIRVPQDATPGAKGSVITATATTID